METDYFLFCPHHYHWKLTSIKISNPLIPHIKFVHGQLPQICFYANLDLWLGGSSLLGVHPQHVAMDSDHAWFRLNRSEHSTFMSKRHYILEVFLHTHFCTSLLSGSQPAKIVTPMFQTIWSEILHWDKERKKKILEQPGNFCSLSIHRSNS